jgi:ABC-type sugar transport system permease subunit
VAPYLFLLPYLLITAVFFLYPLVYASILAFYQTNGPTQRAFVGMSTTTTTTSKPTTSAPRPFACSRS